MADPFDLERFVRAQAPVFDQALAELRAGRKQSHWMWFVFPQLRGLGRSPTARLYGISGLEEAAAFLAHPLLGPRLRAATDAAAGAPAPTLHALFGPPDDLKFVSSMTLFALAQGQDGGPFQRALGRWNQGQRDEATLRLISPSPSRRG
jgi:uncharacterized protein (DUF1810 family)